MLDLSNLPCTATMRLTKAVPRKEGAGMAWDFDLVQEIPDKVGAEIVDKYLPGTIAVWDAREGSKGSTSTSGGFDLLRVTFENLDGVQLATGHGEIRGATCKVSASQAVLIVKIRVHGLLQKAAIEVVYSLDDHLQVALRPNTTQLNLLPKVESVSLEGQLIVHRTPNGVVAGVVTSHKETVLGVATLEEPEIVRVDLPVDGVPDTCVEICVEDGVSLRDLLITYIERCDRSSVRSSWQDVVTAMGRLFASSELEPAADNSWVITQKVMDAAFEVASKARQ